MPTINRIKYINIGHPNAIFDNLELTLFNRNVQGKIRGASTYILADNGVGKTSLISLVFSVIRPFNYEFPRGEGNKKRELIDYIPYDGTSHVLIEWILDTKDEMNFLLTGMAVERSNKNLKLLFYSSKYTALIKEGDLNFDNFPILNEHSNYIQINDLRKILKEKKEKLIKNLNYTKKKHEWEDILKDYYIEPEIYQIQAKMNQRESSQDTMMSFGNNIEFIEKLVELITPFEDSFEEKEQVRSIQLHFEEIKNLPVYKERVEFYSKLSEELKKGLEIGHENTALRKELNEFISQWNKISYENRMIKQKLNYNNKNLNSKIKSLNKKLKFNEKILQKREIENLRVKGGQCCLTLRRMKNETKKCNENKKLISKEKILLNNISEYREIKELENRINDIESMIKKTSAPLRQKFEKMRDHFGIALNYQVDRHMELIMHRQDAKTKIEKLYMSIISKISSYETSIINYENRITEIKEKIQYIDDQVNHLIKEGILDDLGDVSTNLKRIREKIDSIEEEIKNLESVSKDIQLEDQQVLDKKYSTNSRLGTLIVKLTEVKEFISEAEDMWNKITITNYFKRNLDPDLIGTKLPSYIVFANEEFMKVEKAKNDIQLKIVSLNSEENRLDEIFKYAEVSKTIPPNEDVKRVLAFLEKEGINADFGWNYLTTNYQSNSELVKAWAKSAPHLLEGLVIIYPSLKEVFEILKKKQFRTRMPLFLSDAKLFSNYPSISERVNSLILQDAIKWKYDSLEFSSYISDLKKDLESLIEQRKRVKKELNSIDEFQNKCKEFTILYPEESFSQKRVEFERIKREIESSQQLITNLNNESVKLKEKKTKIDKEIQDLRFLLQEAKDSRLKLTEFKTEWESKKNLEIEKSGKINEVENLRKMIEGDKLKRNDLRINIDEIGKEIEQLSTKKTEFSQELKYLPINIENKYHEIKDKEILSEIILKNLDTLRHEYSHAKDDFESDSTIEQNNKELKEKRTKRKRIRDKLDKRLKKRVLSLEDIEEFSKVHEDLIDDEIDDKIIQCESEIDRIQEEIAALEQEINRRIDIKNQIEKELEQRLLDPNNEVNINKLKEFIDLLEMKISKIIEKIEDNHLTIQNNEDQLEKCISLQNGVKTQYEKSLPIKNMLEDLKESNEEINITPQSSEIYDEISDIPEIEHVVKSMDERVNNLIKSSTDLRKKIEGIRKKIEGFVNRIHLLGVLPEESRIQKDRVVKFVQRFERSYIDNLDEYFNELDANVFNFNKRIQEHNENLDHIVEVYARNIINILKNIYQLKNTKIPVPGDSELNNKQVFDLELNIRLTKEEDKEFIKKQIREYFLRLGRQEKFPERLKIYKHLVKELIKECVKSRIKMIKFLVPRPGDLKPEYRNLEETLKASGGETGTIAILLYCLIAHYRMKELYSKTGFRSKKNIPSSTFIMDNPFGKTNRLDLVKVQLALANALNIQIFAFSGHQDVNIIDQFTTVLPLRAYYDEANKETVIDLDMENINYKIKGDSITRVQNKTIESFI